MENINEQSELVRRIHDELTDMSDRLEGKQKKSFLYRNIGSFSIENELFIDELMTLRYIAEKRMDDQAIVLKKKLAEHERNLLKLIWQRLGERIIYNEQLIDTVQQTIVPYYHGRFRIELSREISFLPLTVRLLIYTRLLEKEANPMARHHILDRITLTLYKIGDERLGEYSLFLKCMLGVKLHPPLFGHPDFETLFTYEIKANKKVRGLRETIFSEAHLTPEIAGREFWYGFKSFSDLKNVNDVDAAKICLRLFVLYFEKNFSIAQTVETQMLKYYMTKNPNVIKKLILDEQLDELNIRSRYAEGVLGASEGPDELDERGTKKYEDDIRHKVKRELVLIKSRLRVNGKRPGLDESLLVIPEVLGMVEIIIPLSNLSDVLSTKTYTLNQIDTFMGNLLKSVLKSDGWEPPKLNILLGAMKEIRLMLWAGEEKNAIKVLRVLRVLMQDSDIAKAGWPVSLVINDAMKSPIDYMIIYDTTGNRYPFDGVAFTSSPGRLIHVLRNKREMIQQSFVLPLRIIASDWTKIASCIGLSDKESKSLERTLKRLYKNVKSEK
ncbi:hypothetical protein RIF24_16380 (plasmid) [Exiguobacterium acetylicum]|uniref:hypothetical protein n=1 Tax=Exiguobacterium acetylicum TaxID=41170 RepID=UPI003977A042